VFINYGVFRDGSMQKTYPPGLKKINIIVGYLNIYIILHRIYHKSDYPKLSLIHFLKEAVIF
jgi:hypothetical protein